MDILPAEIREEIFRFLESESQELGYSLDYNLGKFYKSSPFAQQSIDTTKAIISYLINKRIFYTSDLNHIAICFKDYPVFQTQELNEWLKQQYIKLSNQEALREAAWNLNTEMVLHFINLDIDINAPNSTGETALLKAVKRGGIQYKNRRDVAEALLKAGADPNCAQIKINLYGMGLKKISLLKYTHEVLHDPLLEQLLMQYGAQ
jgi:ankyrin repeat protein